MAITIKTGPKNWQFYNSSTGKTSEIKHSNKTDKQPSMDDLNKMFLGDVSKMTLANAEKLHTVYGFRAQAEERVKKVIERDLSDLSGMTQEQIEEALKEAFEDTLGKMFVENGNLLDPASLCTFYHSFSVVAREHFEKKVQSATSLAELRTASSVGDMFIPAMDKVTKELSSATINSLIDNLNAEIEKIDVLKEGGIAARDKLKDAIKALEDLIKKYKLPDKHAERLAAKKEEIKALPKEIQEILGNLNTTKATKAEKEQALRDLVTELQGLRDQDKGLRDEEIKLIQDWVSAKFYGMLTEEELAQLTELLKPENSDVAEVGLSNAERAPGSGS